MAKKKEQNIDVLVIGGGASGMMAAGRAAETGAQVILLEKNKALGEKLKITGGGRCNITNAEYDTKELLVHYGAAAKFLHSPFARFGVAETFDFFESHGLPLVVEDRKRAFPHTHQAMDVFLVMEKYLRTTGVQIITDSPALQIIHTNGHIDAVETATHIFHPGKVIIATGGTSHPETGSTGDGFGWIRDLGHTVHEPTPDVVPLAVTEPWIHSIAGVSLEEIKITFYTHTDTTREKSFAKKGRVLCTHFGLSGPMILNSAGQVRDLLYSGVVTAQIDLFPSVDIGTLEKNILAVFDLHKNKTLKNTLSLFLPNGFAPAFAKIFPDIDLATKVHSVTKEDRKQIVHGLKDLNITIDGLMGFDRAVISDGGVVLDEIDTKTMRSKKVDNLYITGDLLHISRPSGGYSLQLCWTTGWVAGSSLSHDKSPT